MADPLATRGGWEPAIRDDPFGHFADARTRCPVQQVRLADGHPAWVVLGYDAARQALNHPRISKDMLAALEEASDVVAEGLPGPEFSRHMLNVDPPDHTRPRRPGLGTRRRSGPARPRRTPRRSRSGLRPG
jgi:cytochrome P450